MQKTVFAVLFGNRGFFPASVIAAAREEMKCELNALGYEVLMLDPEATRYGAVETPQEGEVFASFLTRQPGEIRWRDRLPAQLWRRNRRGCGAEGSRGADLGSRLTRMISTVWARHCGAMRSAARSPSWMCFRQYGVKFTALKPHTVRPGSERFKANIDQFDRVCRVVNGVKGMVVGSIGARTTPFKTVRIDEVTLQRHGITVETFDLSDIFHRMKAVRSSEPAYQR